MAMENLSDCHKNAYEVVLNFFQEEGIQCKSCSPPSLSFCPSKYQITPCSGLSPGERVTKQLRGINARKAAQYFVSLLQNNVQRARDWAETLNSSMRLLQLRGCFGLGHTYQALNISRL